MSVLIGLDVGWSETRRTCGVAVLGEQIAEPGTNAYGDIRAVALKKGNVARVLSPIVRRSLLSGQRVLFVADAVVGSYRVPQANRVVDERCSKGGFRGRCQSYPATQDTGRLLSTTLHDIMDQLSADAAAAWTPWLGASPLPVTGLVVIETNPTTSMALALAMADRGSLPTRRLPRKLLDGTCVRAKSDWYWRSGAGKLAAQILDTRCIRDEVHHERVAALWCLALARALDISGEVALLGDDCGTYLVGSIDPSWAKDVDRVGVKWGQVHQVARALESPISTLEPVVDLSADEGDADAPAITEDDDALRGDEVRVLFTDNGGLSKKANPWLDSVEFPCRLLLHGRTQIKVKVLRFEPPNDRSQFKVDPTTQELMKKWDGPATLSKSNSFQVLATVLSG